MHTSCCHAARPATLDAAAASRAAERAARPERGPRPRCQDDADSAPARRTERSHPLVVAMTEALRSLMPADRPTEPSRELKDSARDFAHELADALRGGPGRGHGHGPHRARHGYDDLAQRVERLAGAVSPPASAGATTTSTTLSASLSMASIELSVEGERASASLSMTTLELEVSQQTGTGGAPSTDSPLLAAFRRLMTALQPGEAAATGSGAEQLGSFLRQLASALRGGDAASDAPAGSLISVAA